MLNCIKKLFYSERFEPAIQLCHDIQNDYYELHQDGRYMKRLNSGGFLEDAFYIDMNGIKVRSSNQTNDSFQLDIIDLTSDNSVFCVKIFYGVLRNDTTKSVLYIQDFSRLSKNRRGFGKKMGFLIRKFVEERKFDFIELHPVAFSNIEFNTMNQEQLEQFYREIFNSRLFIYKEVENLDEIETVEFEIRW